MNRYLKAFEHSSSQKSRIKNHVSGIYYETFPKTNRILLKEIAFFG